MIDSPQGMTISFPYLVEQNPALRPASDGATAPARSLLLSNAFAAACKRVIDFTGALCALAILSPLLLFVAILIKLDSRGPILFRQTRLGHRGREFRVWKFRTMVVDAEAKLKEIEHLNESEGGILFKMKADPRVTPLGRFLRRSSIDELPQLINVLRGEMSLVGPRPLQMRDSERLRQVNRDGFYRRLEQRPGLSGPWQVSGRSAVAYEQMLAMDLEYIEKGSLALDFVIILKTIHVVFTGKGAC